RQLDARGAVARVDLERAQAVAPRPGTIVLAREQRAQRQVEVGPVGESERALQRAFRRAVVAATLRGPRNVRESRGDACGRAVVPGLRAGERTQLRERLGVPAAVRQAL